MSDLKTSSEGAGPLAGTDLDRRLLADTLQKARAEVPFYRDALAGIRAGQEIFLSDFPLIDKRIVADHFEAFLALDRFPDYLTSSGGTMANSGAFSLRAQEEYEAVYYHVSGRNPRVRFDADPDEGFAIDVFTHTNGYHWRKPPGLPVLPVTLEQESHARFIARLVRQGLPIRNTRSRVIHLQGQCGPMRALTGYFEASGALRLDVGDAPSLLVYGSHTTRAWKARHAAVWGAVPAEIYGLTEFAPGSAHLCGACGGFHFRTCWPEFLDLEREAPRASGDARLVLTSLYPFVQLQPRIRYRTGDIVTLTGVCDATGRASFRFRGRENSSVFGPGEPSRVLFSEVEIHEVLEQMPDVACQMQVAERRIWESATCGKPPYEMGYPRCQIAVARRAGRVRACVGIEVRFDPDREPARRDRFIERFLTLLKSEAPGLGAACEAWLDLTVKLHPEASLPIQVKASA